MHWLHNKLVNSADPDETAPAGAVSSGSSLFTDMVLRRLPPAAPNGATFSDVTVMMVSPGVFNITMIPNECGNGFPLFQMANSMVTAGDVTDKGTSATTRLSNGGSGHLAVERLNKASPPLRGSLDVTFRGNTRSGMSVSNSEEQFQRELETIDGIGSLTVAKYGNCAAFDLAVTFNTLPGDLPEMTVDPKNLRGVDVNWELNTVGDGSLQYEPLMGDMLSTFHAKPQVTLTINNIKLACEGDCSFEWDDEFTPTVTGVSPSLGTLSLGTSIEISGTGFVDSSNTVMIGGLECIVTAATETSITCDVGNGPVGHHKVMVTVGGKGHAAHPNGDVMFEYTADITGILPTSGGLGGGNYLDISGYGFNTGAEVTINSEPCVILSIQQDEISCVIPSQTTGGTYAVIVTMDSTSLSFDGYTYLQSSSAMISSILPETLGVEGGIITITGSGFGDTEGPVFVGSEMAAVISWSDDTVVAEIGPLDPGAHTIVIKLSDGTALWDNALPEIHIELSIIKVNPLLGSVAGGTKLTISGSGFGNETSSASVTVGGTPCDIFSMTDTQIKCLIGHAGKVHHVTNQGVDRAFGIFYAYDKPYLNINLGDYVLWSWTTPSFVEDVQHAVIEVASPYSYIAKRGGFNSGTPSKNGHFQYQFTQAGMYYVWSGYVDKYEIKNYFGAIEVGNMVSSIGEIDVQVHGKSALHKVKESSVPNENYGCGNNVPRVTDCIDDMPSGGDPDKFNFAFLPCTTPIVSSIDPRSGTVQTEISIDGEGLSHENCPNEITVGESSCTVKSVSESSITCNLDKTEAPEVGIFHAVEVRVGNHGNAILNIMNPQERRFALEPSIENIQPVSGSLAGGTILTISGVGFDALSLVDVGGYECSLLSVTSSEILCETPLSEYPRTLDITVISVMNGQTVLVKCETKSEECSYNYDFDLTATIASISPGSVSDTTTLIISGTRLGTSTSDLDVTVGGVQATVLSASETEIEVSVNNIPAGTNDVVVKLKDYGRAIGQLVVEGEATITSVTPSSGSVYGEQFIMVRGNGFVSDELTTVMLGGVECEVASVSLSELVFITPPHSSGNVSLLIASNSVHYEQETFLYDGDMTPTVTSVIPYSGLAGSIVTIQGMNFEGGAVTVLLDDVPCEIVSSTDTEIECIAGDHATGPAPIYVHVNDFGASNTDVYFEYELTVVSISPAQGSKGGGQTVTLSGTGFTSVAKVEICEKLCPLVETTTTEYVCKTPTGSDGTCSVTVSLNDLTKQLTNVYTYDSELTTTVSNVSPNRGGTAGGTIITITGSGFGTSIPDAAVMIDGTECVVDSVTDTEITCETGPHNGTVKAKIDVEIDGNGLAIESNPCDFEYIDMWSSSFTWGGGPLPAAGEIVVIQAGQTVLLDTDTPVIKVILIQGGALIFDEVDLELNAEIILITDGGLLQIGTEDAPFQHKATVTLHGHVRSKELPIYGTKVLALRNGTVDLHGQKIPDTWTHLAETAEAGATEIHLVLPLHLKKGDEIVIASTSHHKSQSENEKKTITAVSTDNKTLTLDSALEATHVGTEETFGNSKVQFRAEVGLLTRNVVVKGNPDSQWNDKIDACEDGFEPGQFAGQTCFLGRHGDEIGSSEYGAMIIVKSPVQDTNCAVARISYTELTFVGQAFRMGRYPVHFHLNGDMSSSYVRGCSIHKSFNRAVNIHGVSNILVERNVIYNVKGGAFFMEDGIETGNILQYNLAVFVKTSSSLLNDDITPAAFWVTNPNNIIQHNSAAGGTHFGFWYRMEKHPTGPSFTQSICCQNTPLGVFYNNTAHSCGWYGLWIFPKYHPYKDSCSRSEIAPAHFDDFFAWNNEKGLEFGQGGSLQFDHLILVGNRIANFEGRDIDCASIDPDDRPMIKNSLIVGKTAVISNSVHGCTNVGLVLPNPYYFHLNNVTFVNFDDPSCHALQTTGGTYITEGLTFINSPYQGVFDKEWDSSMIADVDGTVTGYPGVSQVVPMYDILPSDCVSSGRNFSNGFPLSVCPEEYNFHRFTYSTGDRKMWGQDLIFENQYGNESFPPTSMSKGQWTGYLVDGETYDIKFSFEDELEFTNYSFNLVLYEFEFPEQMIVKFRLKQIPDIFKFNGRSIEPRRTLNPENATLGEWAWDSNERKVEFIIKGGHRSNPKLMQCTPVSISIAVYKCYYPDCIIPLPPELAPPESMPPFAYDDWHNKELWEDTEDGYITAIPYRNGTYGIPLAYDNVRIPANMWIIINDTINILGALLIEGRLEIIDNPAGLHYELNANYITILGGRLIAGWDYSPFRMSFVSIRMRERNGSLPVSWSGSCTNTDYKTTAVYGGLDLHGKWVQRSWTRLASTAAKGSNQLFLENSVDWSEGDDIVIGSTSYAAYEGETRKITSVSANKRTLTLNQALQYKHIAHDVTINGLSISMSAVVGLLTRNIKVIGEGETGASVHVGICDTPWRYYRGYARLSNVEFYHMGQNGAAALAYDKTGNVNHIKPSFVTSCAFWEGFGAGISSDVSRYLNLTSNVIYQSIGSGIIVNSDDTRVVNNVVVSSLGRLGEPGIEAYKGKNNEVHGNIVAGSQGAGIHMPPLECDDESEAFGNNVMQSCNSGYSIFPSDRLRSSCVKIAGIIAWRNGFGLYYQGVASLIIENNVFLENRNGIFTMVNGPNAVSHTKENKMVEVRNLVISGSTPAFDCSDDMTSWKSVLARTRNDQPVLSSTGGMIGIVFPNFMSRNNHAPFHAYTSILTCPAIAGLMSITNVTFAYFGTKGCQNDVALATNKDNDDLQHPVEASDVTFVSTSEDNKLLYHRPNIDKINPSDCVDMDCDGLKKALFKDVDGTFLGAVGSVIPQSEYEWNGDPARGLGDYRIPKAMVTALDGTRIPYSTLMPNKGIIRSDNCTYMSAWQAYKCFDYNYEMFILESMDSDSLKRRISPVAILSEGYVDLINGPQDHGWCFGYTCRQRLSTFAALVATDLEYLVHFTGTTPRNMRYHLLNVEPDQGIKVTVWYSRPNRLDVYANGNYVIASNAEVNRLGYYVMKKPVGDEFTPVVTDDTGTNYFDRDAGLLSFIVKGPSVIEVKTSNLLIVSFGLPAMTVDDFYGPNLIENLAGFFNIPLTKIRLVNVVSASSFNRLKRSTSSGVTVDMEIGNEPAEDINTTVSDSMEYEDLLQLSLNIINECQTGNISWALNSTGECDSIILPVTSTNEDPVTYTIQKPVRLAFHQEPVSTFEGNILQNQPKIQSFDESDVVVQQHGLVGYSWQMTVSIRAGTGHPDATLTGNLTVNSTQGWFNFTDLAISQVGEEYILDFNITYPRSAKHFTLESQPIDIQRRPLKAKVLSPTDSGRLHPDTQFSKTLDLHDRISDEIISNIAWRSHTWNVSAEILGNPRYGQINGTTEVTFDPVTGQATFYDLQISHFGVYYIQFKVVSSPAEYNFTVNHKVTLMNPKFSGQTLDTEAEISIKFDEDFNTTLSDEDTQNAFEQFIFENFTNEFLDIDFQSTSIRRGSIVVTFVIAGNESDVTAAAQALCDSAYDTVSYIFNGYNLTLSQYMTYNGQSFYGVSCHSEDSDKGLNVGIIAGAAVGAFVMAALVVVLIVCLCCKKPKTKEHAIPIRNNPRRIRFNPLLANKKILPSSTKISHLHSPYSGWESPLPVVNEIHNTKFRMTPVSAAGTGLYGSRYLRTPEPIAVKPVPNPRRPEPIPKDLAFPSTVKDNLQF